MQNSSLNALQEAIRVLIVTPDAGEVAPLTTEMMRRGALVAVASDVSEAGAAVRSSQFEAIFVASRGADPETALLIQLLRGACIGAPRLLFLANPDQVAAHPVSVTAADATIASTLPPVEIADIAVQRRKEPSPQIEVQEVGDSARTEAAAASPDAERSSTLIPAAETIARAAEAIARAAETIARSPAQPSDASETIEKHVAAQVPTATAAPQHAPLLDTQAKYPQRAAAAAAEVRLTAPDTMDSPRASQSPAPERMDAPVITPPPVPHAPLAQAAQPAPAPAIVPTPAPAASRAPELKPTPPSVVPPPPRPLERLPQQASPLSQHATVTPPQAKAPVQPEVVATPERGAAQAGEQPRRRFYEQHLAATVPPGSTLSKYAYAVGWFLFAGMLVGLTTWPISTQAQFTLGLAVIAVMTVIRKLRLGGVWRPIFLALGVTMILRYVYWRSTNTLPPMHDWMNFVPGFTLYLAEMYCVMMFFISLFIIADPIERKPPPQLPEDRLPTVDVFIPTYNEGSDLLAATVAAANQMDYPKHKLKVYLLDDGGTDQKCNQPDAEKAAEARARRVELQALCAELGITYITRARNEHAKAGNMNNALQQTNGQIIVVFDADHAPARQFLRETVGYFALDRKLFLVQTPHFFLNPDPIEKNLQTFDRMPSENEMFYGTIQKGLDKWNGAFFCGSAALLARRALESVGGFSGISITEDCETALDLHTRGWNSLYVDKPLIAGLQPESLVSFIGQRSRWCRGMIQILVLKNPILKKNISLKQRIAYVSSMFYWLFPIPRIIFLVSPFLYIFFNMQIFVSNAQEFFSYITIYMLTHMTIQNYLYGSTRWPWISEAYEYVQSLYLVKGIWGVLINPRKPTFNVTAKGLTLDKDHLSELALPYFISFGVILASLVVACYRFLAESELNELLLIVGGWSFYNLVIAGVALGIVAERRERRKTPRLKIARNGELTANGVTVPVEIKDCSIGGMRIRPIEGRLPAEFARGGACMVRVTSNRPNFETDAIPCILRNVSNDGSGAIYGLQFNGLTPAHYRGIADAMYSDMQVFENFRAGRRRIKGITLGTLQFFWWSLNHTIRAFYYAIALRKLSSNEASTVAEAPAPMAAQAPQTVYQPASPAPVHQPVVADQPTAEPAPVMARNLATAH